MDSIVKVRTIAPNLPGGIVHRVRLNNALRRNLDKNLIIVSSPAGFGKTTFIQDFLSETKIASAWILVSSDMDNIYTFMNYLINSLRNINENFGTDTAQVIEFCRENYRMPKHLKTIVGDITGTFTNEFMKLFKDEIAIVLDDLGNLGGPEWLVTLMNALLENIPANMHFIMTTREVPEINLSQLSAKRKVFKLENEDLIFTHEETSELLESIYHTSYSEKDILALEANIGGWITGIHLILQTWGENFAKLKLYNETVLEDIFVFFAEDIFRSLDERTKNFLLDTALLENFTPDTINRLLNITGSKLILDNLLKKNIFLQVKPLLINGAYEMTYNYQVLFTKFLISKIHKVKTRAERDLQIRRISDYYLDIKDYDRAINYGLMCRNTDFVIPLIVEKSREFYDRGEFDSMWKWMSGIGEDAVSKNPYLLYYKSLLMKNYLGEVERSLEYDDKAILLFESNGQDQFVYKCIISKSRNLLSIGRTKEAIANLEQIRDVQTDPVNKADLLYLMAYSFYLNSAYNDSLELLNEALELCIENKIRKIQTDIYNLFGHIYLIRGEYDKAVQYYEKVVKSSFGPDDKLETLCNLVLMHSQSGNFEKAEEFYEQAKGIIERIPIPIFKIALLLAKQAFFFEFGDYEGAITILREMQNIALKMNHHFYIYLSRVLIADAYYYLNMLAKAEEYYELAFSYIDDENKLEKNQYAFMKALLLKKESFELQTSASLQSIENVLLEVYQFYGDNKFCYNRNHAAFHLADFYLKQGLGSAAKQFLAECLKTAREKNYQSYLQREYMDSRRVFDFAIANNIEKDFVKSIIRSVLVKDEHRWLTPSFRTRLETRLRNYYDVSVNTFSKLEFYVRGRLIPESEWRKKKWKLALLYLFLNSKHGVTKDRIIDVFYPDTPVESVDNIFHQLVSKLRSILRVENIFSDLSESNDESVSKVKNNGRKSPKKMGAEIANALNFLSYEDKVLKLSADFNYDIDIIRFEKYYRLAKSEKDRQMKIERLKNAVNLYKGEFLEGVYEAWSDELRNKARNNFISLCEELINLLYNNKSFEEVISYSEYLLNFDKLNESAYLYSIKAFVEWERLNSAREKYSQLLKSYDSELGEKPPDKILKQIEQILHS